MSIVFALTYLDFLFTFYHVDFSHKPWQGGVMDNFSTKV